jgi:uncharacterized protein
MQLFEWDEQKAHKNFDKHGVSFLEASTVFADTKALRFFDVKHSQVEDRWLVVGRSLSGYVLTTVYTERGTNIRLISSRRANAHEIQKYGNQ